MQSPVIAQIRYETDTLKRWLLFLSDENNLLKDRIVILFHKSDDLLLQAENFHEKFLNNDTMISSLRRAIAEFEEMLEDETAAMHQLNINQLKAQLMQLRNESGNAVKHVFELMSIFNDALVEALLNGTASTN